MKKLFFSILGFLCYIFCLGQANITIDGRPYVVDTIAHYQVGPGSYYTQLNFKNDTYPQKVYFLEIDATSPYIKFESVTSRDSIWGMERPSAMAARKSKAGHVLFGGTNGDFYNTTNGLPISGFMTKGQVGHIPVVGRGTFGITSDNIPLIRHMQFQGTIKASDNSTQDITKVNDSRGSNECVLYNSIFGKHTRTNNYGTEVLIELTEGGWSINSGTLKAKVLEKYENKGSSIIPEGKAILSAHGTSQAFLNKLNVGDAIELNLSMVLPYDQSEPLLPLSEMVGGSEHFMLRDGQHNGPNWEERHPRTGIGYSQDKKKIFFCVVDGRQAGISLGVTTYQLAEIMLFQGASTALNLDGGGSSNMYIKEYGQINIGSDGSERNVSNAIFAVATSPEDNAITSIAFQDYNVKVPVSSLVKPAVLGYNQYGLLVTNNLSVTYSCDPEFGYIDEKSGAFVASGNKETGILNAEYNRITVSKEITVDKDGTSINLKLDSVIIDDQIKYTIEVLSSYEGKVYPVNPATLSWTIDNPAVCKIENGVLSGLANGESMITGTLGSYSDKLKVKVQIVEKSPYYLEKFDNMDSFVMGKTSNLKDITVSSTDLPEGWEHGSKIAFNYGSKGRGSYVALNKSIETFSLPDSMYLTINPGNAILSEISVNCAAKNGLSKKISVKDIIADKDIVIGIALNQLGDLNDRAAYPFLISSISFYINDGKAASGTDMYLSVKDVKLTYSHLQTGIDAQRENSSSLVVFPNPVERGKDLTVKLPLGESDTRVSVYSATGSLVFQADYPAYEESVNIPAGSLPSGIYFINVAKGNLSQTAKVIVK
ncbi:MAG: phosphodiester glycosidase family protein [Dysgonomonas sp.]